MTTRRHGAAALGAAVLGAALVFSATALAAVPSATATQTADEEPGLYLVTLTGPGVTGTPGPETGSAARARLRAAQDATLASVGAAEPVYRVDRGPQRLRRRGLPPPRPPRWQPTRPSLWSSPTRSAR